VTASGTGPSLTYHPKDQRVWIAAEESGTGKVRFTRLNPATGAVDAWNVVGGTTTPPLHAPTIVSDGSLVRMFALGGSSAEVFQSLHDGVNWSTWRPLIGAHRPGNRQPAAANMNGVVNLVTSEPLEMMEQAID
jgi:hypothetical protein